MNKKMLIFLTIIALSLTADATVSNKNKELEIEKYKLKQVDERMQAVKKDANNVSDRNNNEVSQERTESYKDVQKKTKNNINSDKI